MKRNHSMPKMNMIEIQNRLNRLKARNKPRLQFPTHIESKKHYFNQNSDNFSLGSNQNLTPIIKGSKRNNLDISDIEGARPKVIQKQKNIMNYYQNKNEEYNPFAGKEMKISRSASDSKININNKNNIKDSLDMFQKQLQQKLLLNPQNKRQSTEPSLGSQNKYDLMMNRKINLQNSSSLQLNKKYAIKQQQQGNPNERKSLVYNPTFMSNLFLL